MSLLFRLTILTLTLTLTLMLLLAACSESNDAEPSISGLLIFDFDLETDAQDWSRGFANYPEGAEAVLQLQSEWTSTLPDPLESEGAIFISGDNQGSNPFMFIKRRLIGLKPGTRYSLVFGVEIATNADSGCAGQPGEDVVVKVGAATQRPEVAASMGMMLLNIDHGDQSSSGSDAIVIGNIASTQTDCTDDKYELKILNNEDAPFEVYTDSDGAVWAIVGTHSGFEGTTGIYFTHLQILAQER